MRLKFPIIMVIALVALAMTFTISASENHNWRLVGKAKLKVLFWDIYQAELSTPSGTYQGIEGPLKLHLTYFIDIDAQELAKETENQWQEIDNPQFIKDLESIFPDLVEDDTLTMKLNADGTATLLHNNEFRHHFEASEQVDKFLAIWLSPQTTRPELRKILIGKNAR